MKYILFFALFSFNVFANTDNFQLVDLNNDDKSTMINLADCKLFYSHDFYNKGTNLYNFNPNYKTYYPDAISYVKSLYEECNLFINNTIKSTFNGQLKNPTIEANSFYFNVKKPLKFSDIHLISSITSLDFNLNYLKPFNKFALKDELKYTYIEVLLKNGTQFKIYFGSLF